MKNKNGFTLVELLAVITVIAVLLSIATTSTVSVLNKGRKRTEKLSAKEYITAINDYNFIAKANEKISTTNCDCSQLSANIIKCKVEGSNGLSTIIKESIDGKLPKSGTVNIDKTTNKVVSARIKVNHYTVNYNNNKYKIN